MKTKSLLGAVTKLSVLIVVLCAGVYFFRFTDAGRKITPDSVLSRIEQYGPVSARVIYVGLYIVGTVALLPGTVLSFAGAYLFGAYQGTMLTWVGATIGATLAFLLAKALGRDFVEKLFVGRFDAFDKQVQANGFQGLLVIRLLPIFPFNAVNFGSGLTSIGLRDYVTATALGILPGTFVYQYLFAKFGRRILTDGFRVDYFADIELWISLGLFVAFIFVGRQFTRKSKPEKPPVDLPTS